MLSEEKIRNIVESAPSGKDFFVVDIAVKPGNRIEVYFDSPWNVTIADCAELTRLLKKELPQEAGNYELVVSSPGADKPLKDPRQFQKNTGRQVTVILNDNKVHKGILKSFDNDKIILSAEEKKEQKPLTGPKSSQKEMEFHKNEIKSVTVDISFKK